MNKKIFTAGVTPGSPTTESEVKILICHILASANTPLTFEQIHETLREDNVVNYFQLVGDIQKLILTNHIVKNIINEIEFFELTAVGKKTSDTLIDSLPKTIVQKVTKSLFAVIERAKRLAEIRADITPLEDGFLIKMSIPSESQQLVSFSVFTSTRTEADNIRRNFLNDPVYIYHSVLALVTRDGTLIDNNPKIDKEIFN